MSEHSSSHHLNIPLARTKRRRTSIGLRQPEQTASHQDQVSSELSSPPHTSTPTSRPTTASCSTSTAVGSRDTPIEILSPGDEPPSISRAKRRWQSASSITSTPSGRPRPALHAARPEAKIRSVSDPLPRQVRQEPSNSDSAIEALILEPPKTREGRASVYVMAATHEKKTIVKIGFTTSVNQRIKQLEQTCRCIKFKRDNPTDLHPPPIDLYYGTVERLAHTELQHLQYPFDCTCKKRHAEYFEVDVEVARHIVQRWTQFCEARPWEAAEAGQKLKLKDQWRDCLAGWKEEHGRPVAAEDIEARVAQWDRFVHTPRWKWLWYDVRVWSAWLSRFWSQALLVVACVVIRCQVRDQGWLARGAEVIMLMTIARLGGFRCVAAEGLLEPLLKTGWTVVPAGPKKKGDDYSRKVMYQDAWADSGDEDEDRDDGDDGEEKNDMGNREEKSDVDNRENKGNKGDRDNRGNRNTKNDIDNRDKRDNRDDRDDSDNSSDSDDSDDSDDTDHTDHTDDDIDHTNRRHRPHRDDTDHTDDDIDHTNRRHRPHRDGADHTDDDTDHTNDDTDHTSRRRRPHRDDTDHTDDDTDHTDRRRRPHRRRHRSQRQTTQTTLRRHRPHQQTTQTTPRRHRPYR